LEVLKPEKAAIAISMVALAFSSGATLVLPATFGKMIDMLTDPLLSAGDFQTLSLGLGGVFLVAAGASFVRVLLLGLASQRIVLRLRSQLFGALAIRSVSFFDEHTSGELVNRLSADAEIMSKGLIENCAHGIRRVVEGIGGVAVILWLSPKLTLLMLSVVPPVFLGAFFYGKKVSELSAKVTDKLAAATAFAEERLGAIRTVRLFAQEPKEIAQYTERATQVFEVARKAAILNASFVSSVFFGVNAALLLVLYSGASMVMQGAMTPGELTSFLLYSAFTGVAFSGIGNFYSEFVRSLGSSHRVFGLIDGAETDPHATRADRTDLQKLEHFEGAIRFEDLQFAYPTRPDAPILRGLDMKLEPGTTMAVVGHSGSGKSTLAALFTRLYEPSQGRIFLDDSPVDQLDPIWLRSHVGVVPQDVTLFSGSIAENIAYGLSGASQEQIEAAAREANAHDFIQKFPQGYQTPVGERGTSLSGGQKQRIAIARALLKNPKILILDEATSALDVESEFLIQQALQRLMVGRTVLVIAHRLSTIRNAHRISVLDQGVVAESGTFAELTAKEGGLFRKLVERQEL
jgi:ABC-type multidrug transport system fused ATPase/permease subunit